VRANEVNFLKEWNGDEIKSLMIIASGSI